MATTLMLISFSFYLFFGIVNSIILAPARRFKKQQTGVSFLNPDDLQHMYLANKPGILRNVKLLDLCVECYWIFYAIAILLLFVAEWERVSFFKGILMFVSSIPLFMCLDLILTAIGFKLDSVMSKRKESK